MLVVLVQRGSILQLELIGEDEVCIFKKALVNRHDILVHVEPAVIPHHRVQDYDVVSLSLAKTRWLGKRTNPRRTSRPSSTPGVSDPLQWLQLPAQLQRWAHNRRAGHRSRSNDSAAGRRRSQISLLPWSWGPWLVCSLGDCLSSVQLTRTETVLQFWVVVLYWTVLRAATSQPSACMTRVAIVLPTYLCVHSD